MSNEASPRPWRVHEIECQVLQQQVRGLRHAIFDSRDRIVAIPTSCREDADFIVAAANHYKPDLHCAWHALSPREAVAHCHEVAARLGDTPCAHDHLQLAEWIEERERFRVRLCETNRLRDAVKRLCNLAENLLYNYEARYSNDKRSMDFVKHQRDFIAETRAIIGAETK